METRQPPQPVQVKADPPKAKVFDTLPQYMRHHFNEGADETAFCVKRFGVWKKYTWRKYYEIVRELSQGLLSLGLGKKDTVGLCGESAPEWFWGAVAAQCNGNTAVEIPMEASPAEIKFICQNAHVKFAIVSGRQQAEKFLQIINELPNLQKVIYWDSRGMAGNTRSEILPQSLLKKEGGMLMSFNEVLKIGREYVKANPNLFKLNIDLGSGFEIALITYILVPHGQPRGINITHRALISSGRALLTRLRIQPADKLMSGLPSDAGAVGQNYFALTPHLLTGAMLNFPETPETVMRDTRETAPDFVFYPAEFWEKTADGINAEIMGSRMLRFSRALFLSGGYKRAALRMQNKKPNLFRRLGNLPGEMLFFRPLRGKYGLSNVRFAATDGAELRQETFKLLWSVGVELRQTFSLAETGVIAAQGAAETGFATVGRTTAGIEVRITDKGELLARGNGLFDGYDNNPGLTAAVMNDGWFATGKKAEINEKGQLVLLPDEKG